jgi:hypothetical protein
MKRLLLIASLCVAGIVLVPITSASASFTGACTLQGTAEFTPNLNEETQTGVAYKFEDVNHGTCVEASTPPVERKVESAKVEGGTFQGSCFGPGMSEADGNGTLKVAGLAEIKFDLQFHSGGGSVVLEIEKHKATEAEEDGAVTATGTANFFQSQEEAAAACQSKKGVKKLKFEAATAGTIG